MSSNINRKILFFLLSLSITSYAQVTKPVASLVFEKQFIASESFESVNTFDIDKDGALDLFSGSFWYKGPEFVRRSYVGPLKRFGEYYDDFSTIVLDVNKDGNPDVITGGWFEGKIVWKENPGKSGPWTEHIIAHCGNVETTQAWDVDGDGTPEIIPNTPRKPLVIYRLRNTGTPTVTFDSIRISNEHGHGLGYGDINHDGRGDLIVDKGWYECPLEPFKQPWIFHAEFDFVQASVPMLVTDVNRDGLNDLIVGQGHNYGLDWYEQKISAKKIRTWVKHPIDPYNSQFHTMVLTDLDNDGEPELITGKRYRAHDDNDPGAHDPVGLYYFKWNGESFAKQVVRYGPVASGEGKGTGIFFAVVDINNNGWKDIVVAGKDGLCVFFNKGFAK
jgi:hypothetical protein